MDIDKFPITVIYEKHEEASDKAMKNKLEFYKKRKLIEEEVKEIESYTGNAYWFMKRIDDEKKEELQQKLMQLERILEYENECLRKQAKAGSEEYETIFDNAVEEKCSYYADSKLVEKVANWAYTEMAEKIENIDRSSCKKTIYASIALEIYKDKIKCDDKLYDFKVNRLQVIPTPVDQAAIAKVIATKINLQIAVEYPKDPSGTENVVRLEYSYNDEAAFVKILYTADNGNFIEEATW